MKIRLAVLPGDGVGPEVTAEAVKVIKTTAQKFGHEVETREFLIGGCALDQAGSPFPEETRQGSLASDAVLLGAVGGPKYDHNPRGRKPEDGLLGLRRELQAFANIRPVVVYDELVDSSPLKPDVVRGSDMLILRELLGGLYFGTPRGIEGGSSGPYRAYNTMNYTVAEIERIAHIAFKAAMNRNRKVTSVDKSNVLEVSQLWRNVVSRVAYEYPQVTLEHVLVDSFAMHLVTNPRRFDVVVTENLFGDILSDEASVLAGSMGMLPSASIGGRVGLYEPVHGSAPDIAGRKKANPIGAIASAAMMMRHSFGLEAEARAIERAIKETLARGLRTADLVRDGSHVSTEEMGDAICQAITSGQASAAEGH
jgi:3-isopropylmalate dehydrogenase